MAGNVAEWCDGWFDDAQLRQPVRGGTFASDAKTLAIAARDGVNPTEIGNQPVGFRLVKVPGP